MAIVTKSETYYLEDRLLKGAVFGRAILNEHLRSEFGRDLVDEKKHSHRIKE